jgi:hypothetical protein
MKKKTHYLILIVALLAITGLAGADAEFRVTESEIDSSIFPLSYVPDYVWPDEDGYLYAWDDSHTTSLLLISATGQAAGTVVAEPGYVRPTRPSGPTIYFHGVERFPGGVVQRRWTEGFSGSSPGRNSGWYDETYVRWNGYVLRESFSTSSRTFIGGSTFNLYLVKDYDTVVLTRVNSPEGMPFLLNEGRKDEYYTTSRSTAKWTPTLEYSYLDGIKGVLYTYHGVTPAITLGWDHDGDSVLPLLADNGALARAAFGEDAVTSTTLADFGDGVDRKVVACCQRDGLLCAVFSSTQNGIEGWDSTLAAPVKLAGEFPVIEGEFAKADFDGTGAFHACGTRGVVVSRDVRGTWSLSNFSTGTPTTRSYFRLRDEFIPLGLIWEYSGDAQTLRFVTYRNGEWHIQEVLHLPTELGGIYGYRVAATKKEGILAVLKAHDAQGKIKYIVYRLTPELGDAIGWALR